MIYYLVEFKVLRGPYWAEKNKKSWKVYGSTFFEDAFIEPEDKILEKVKAASPHELDWTKTELYVPAKEASYGWLNRDGRFYGCMECTHYKAAEFLIGIEEHDLIDKGWVRVSSNYYQIGDHYRHNFIKLSAEQKNWLSMNGYTLGIGT